jgi:hypothetical protein
VDRSDLIHSNKNDLPFQFETWQRAMPGEHR